MKTRGRTWKPCPGLPQGASSQVAQGLLPPAVLPAVVCDSKTRRPAASGFLASLPGEEALCGSTRSSASPAGQEPRLLPTAPGGGGGTSGKQLRSPMTAERRRPVHTTQPQGRHAAHCLVLREGVSQGLSQAASGGCTVLGHGDTAQPTPGQPPCAPGPSSHGAWATGPPRAPCSRSAPGLDHGHELRLLGNSCGPVWVVHLR